MTGQSAETIQYIRRNGPYSKTKKYQLIIPKDKSFHSSERKYKEEPSKDYNENQQNTNKRSLNQPTT